MQLRVFIRLIDFKDILRTIEAQFPNKLRTTEAYFEFTGPYKKKSVVVMWYFDSFPKSETGHTLEMIS